MFDDRWENGGRSEYVELWFQRAGANIPQAKSLKRSRGFEYKPGLEYGLGL